jgi:hypothetical protein
MFKLIYASLAFLFSTAVVLFTQKDQPISCHQEIIGVVTQSDKDVNSPFIIVTQDNKVYHPVITNETVVLVLGQKVRACYETLGTEPDHSLTISINSTSVVP